jgi:hypothetical protein
MSFTILLYDQKKIKDYIRIISVIVFYLSLTFALPAICAENDSYTKEQLFFFGMVGLSIVTFISPLSAPLVLTCFSGVVLTKTYQNFYI